MYVYLYMYIYIYVHTPETSERYTDQDGKAKAAETHDKAPDAGRLTFQNVGLHFSFY